MTDRELKRLRPCPFCGKPPQAESCDRLIVIRCDDCGYRRGFEGFLTTIPHTFKVNETEYYNPNAHEEAIALWNRRNGIDWSEE